MLLLIRRATTLLRPPALRARRSVRHASQASLALEQRFDLALDACRISANDTVVAAVSGGADSTCLLHLLARAACRVKVVTFDHGQRDIASTGDAAFVQDLAEGYGFGCEAHVWTGGKGTQAQFREWRRATLLKVEGDHVATAHHADDEAELFLLRLARGARLTKVVAGAGVTQGRFVRPLLREPKCALVEYLEDHKYPWREDATNEDASYGTRNLVRHTVVPPLTTLCDGGLAVRLDNLRRQAEAMQAWIDAETGKVLDARRSGALPLHIYREAPEPVRLEVLDCLAKEACPDTSYAVPYASLRDADAKLFTSGDWTLHLPRGVALRVGHGAMSCAEPPPPRVEGRLRVDGRLGHLSAVLGRGLAVPAPQHGPLDLRPRRDGDRFRPQWRDAPQKLSTVLRGQRVPQTDRAATFVLACEARVLAAFPPHHAALVCAAEEGDGEVLVDLASARGEGGRARYALRERSPYDVHVYYDAASRTAALDMREEMKTAFPWMRFYGPKDRPIGPHPSPMWEADFAAYENRGKWAEVARWVEEHRGDLSVLIHPYSTDGDYRDHTENAFWAGDPLPLRLRKPG